MAKDLIKTKKTMADRLPLILAFALPVLIMVGICIGSGIYPFGEASFLRTDLYHQYCPFYTELANRLKEGRSITYAWNIGLGTNYVALAAYYLTCPTMLLLYIVPESFIIEYITLMIILKIGFAGYAMAKYISVKHNTRSYTIVFFALCYSLSGYYAAYSWNIMWLDVLMLAPLVILGIEKLVRENKPILYLVTLTLSIMTNYYLSIMLCIFAVIYFFAQLLMYPGESAGDNLKKLLRFGLYSLVAGAASAVILLPAYYALGTTASSNSTFPADLTSYFSIIEMFAKHFTLVEVETGLEHWPNIYCGVATLLLLPLYYLNKDVAPREKVVKTIVLVILLIGFNLNVLNYIWHGLHFPNSLPARQSYLYIILVLSMGYEGLTGIKKLEKGKIVGVFAGVTAFALLGEFAIEKAELTTTSVYISLIFIAFYALYMYLYNTDRMKKTTVIILAMAVLIVELGVNMAVTSVRTTDRSAYTFDKPAYKTLLSNIDDDDFYRVEKNSLRTKNDGAWIGYNSASLFSSTTPKAISDFYKRLGMEGNTNAYAYTGATPFASSILSVKYILSRQQLDESKLYSLVGSEDGAYLYKNNYTLPLGFVVPSDISDSLSAAANNPIVVQNSFASLINGDTTSLFTELKGSATGSQYVVTAKEDGRLFVKINSTSIKEVTVTVGSDTKTCSNIDRGYLIDLGYVDKDQSATITAKDEGVTIDASTYVFDEEAFIKMYNNVSADGFKLDQFNDTIFDTSLCGSVNSSRDGYLFMSIPYEEGWTVKVNGTEVETSSLSDAFLLVPVTKGHNAIELSYSPKGFKTGLLITNGAIVLIVILILFDRKKRRKIFDEKTEKIEIPEIMVKEEEKVAEAFKVPEVADVPEVQNVPDTQDVPDTPEVSDVTVTLEAPESTPEEISEDEIEVIKIVPRNNGPIDSRD